MGSPKMTVPFLNTVTLRVVGVLAILFLAAVLLWHGNANSRQAPAALVAQVYFDGEYRVEDGAWQPITAGEHIPATRGDVTLRGDFHLRTPDGEYAGVYDGDMPIALYVHHITLTCSEGDNVFYIEDMEDPQYGDSSCGVGWSAVPVVNESEEPLEIRIHNPHRFGNEKAIDEMLSRTALWSGMDFEKNMLASGEAQRYVGLFFVIVALVLLGTALFSTLIHVKNTAIIWVLGTVILFAGAYLSYSSDGVSFWSESIVTNTTLLGCSMMFYMLFLSMAMVSLMKTPKTVGGVAVCVLGAADAVLLLLPLFTAMRFYDTWLYWIVVQGAANAVLFGCVLKELFAAKGKMRWLYGGLLLPLVSFGVDVVMVALGVWRGGLASQYVFILFFVVAMVTVLKIIPQGINTLTKAKELETERVALHAQLTESRVSTMMSQIRPHFIYNTLGSIEQLCEVDPPKAGELVHNFAKYLRGNFGELDNPKPIPMSREMAHVQYYISIEKVRFPDMTFLFEMDSVDFALPALSIQPLVENAVKHGLMKRETGGTIRVVSYETDTQYCVLVEDDGVGFDTAVLTDDRAHMGIRNIRERLKAVVGGSMEIDSTPGVGTRVKITIPKEVRP